MVKDILREIKTRKLQFFAILLITMLGVGFFIGIRVTGYDMRLTAQKYMETANVLDLKVMHTLGVDDEMVKEIDELLDAKAIALRSSAVYADSKSFDNVIQIYEYNDLTKDDLTLLEGRLPKNDKEAVIDSLLKSAFDLDIDDEIKIKKNDIFKEETVTVVGISQSSLYMNKSRGNTSLGSGEISGFAYVSGLEAKLDEVTELRYKFEEDVDVEDKRQLLLSKSEEISENRFKRASQGELDKLDEAEAELSTAKADGLAQIAAEQTKIDAARVELASARQQLEAGMDQLTFGFRLDSNSSLSERIALLKQNYGVAKSLGEKTVVELENRVSELGEGPEFDAAREVLEATLSEERAKLYEIENSFSSGIAQLEVGVNAYEQGVAEVNAGQAAINQAKQDLENEIAANQKKIEDGRKAITNASVGELYALEREDAVIGYKDFYNDSERIEAIGSVFPLIFFGVAILVTLSTITRMVDESRMQLGVYKALGYTWFQASLKYVGFAGLAWSIGMVLGLVIGFNLLPNLIYNTYRILYETPPLESKVVLKYMIIPFLVSFLSSVGVAFYKSAVVSREVGAQLLRPPLPPSGQRIFLERITPLWNRLGFLYKVSFRNLFRNKTRFLMTVIGIGGCAGLLITGFGLENSVNSMIDLQFDEIINYDGFVVYSDDKDIDNKVFDDYTDVYTENATIGENDATMYIVDDLLKFPEFHLFRNSDSKEEIKAYEETIVISDKIAELNDLEVGKEFTFKLDGKSYTSEVGAIIENYANNYIFMSEKAYSEITEKSVEMNMRIFKKANISDDFASEMLENDDVLNITFTSSIIEIFKEQMDNFETIIYVIIFAAFMLELIVLANLITMNISERKKELATLKVLGFYPSELAKYILRENITLTIISLFVGGGFGYFLHKFVILTAELDFIMFNRKLDLRSVVISLVLTFVISLLINLIMSRKANDVDMSEALKTFDA